MMSHIGIQLIASKVFIYLYIKFIYINHKYFFVSGSKANDPLYRNFQHLSAGFFLLHRTQFPFFIYVKKMILSVERN